MPEFDLVALAEKFPWVTIALAFTIAVASILLFMPVARRTGWVDKPSRRKPHKGEVPLTGGWAILLSVITVQFLGPYGTLAPAGYWIGALLVFAVAVRDDRYPVRVRFRFIVQLTAAVAGITLGGQTLTSLGDILGIGVLSEWWIVMPVSIIGIVAVINAFNFTDGADGLCGGIGFISLFWFVIAVAIAGSFAGAESAVPAAYAASLIPLAAALLGGLAAFLFFNMRSPWRSRAVVFMGDGGSMLVGYSLSWFAIHVTTAFGSASVSPVVCLWIVAVPLFDSASCILRRLLARVNPITADNKHLHHLLPRLGLTIGQSVVAIHTGSFLCGLIGVAGWWLQFPERLMFAGFVATLLAYVAVSNFIWRLIDGDGTDKAGESLIA